jgi:hypothetical protein
MLILLTLLRKNKKSLKKLLVVTYVTFYAEGLPYVCIENQMQIFDNDCTIHKTLETKNLKI